jgi:hypothetical protein
MLLLKFALYNFMLFVLSIRKMGSEPELLHVADCRLGSAEVLYDASPN